MSAGMLDAHMRLARLAMQQQNAAALALSLLQTGYRMLGEGLGAHHDVLSHRFRGQS